MKFRTVRFFAIALVVCGSLWAQTITAPPPPPVGPQNATGNGQVGFSVPSLNPNIGGSFAGILDASYSANDPLNASGTATLNGGGASSQVITPNSAQTIASSVINGKATATGTLTNQIIISGQVGQGNGLLTGGPGNFVVASNQTAAGINGASTGLGPMSGSGGASANGQTNGSTSQNGGTAVSQGSTVGQSVATLSIPGITSVSGSGALQAASTEGSPAVTGSPFAVSNSQGTALYGGSGPTPNFAGVLTIMAKSISTLGAGFAATTSTVSSTAGIGGTTPAPTSCGCGHS